MSWFDGGLLGSFIFQVENFVLFCAAFFLFYQCLDKRTQSDLRSLFSAQETPMTKKRGRCPVLPDSVPRENKEKIGEKEATNPFPTLENLQDELTQEWMEAQHEHTLEYLTTKILDTKESFALEYQLVSTVEMPDNPINYGGTYFFFKKLRLELPQYTLFATGHLSAEAKVILDPNTLADPAATVPMNSEEGSEILASMVIVHGVWISTDGYKIAYGYSLASNSNEMSICVREVQTREDSSVDIIRGCSVDYTCVSWVDSRSGFFYTTQVPVSPSEGEGAGEASASSSPLYSNRVYFHKLGTRQANDLLIFETTSASDSTTINIHITSDGHYLLLEIFRRRREITSSSLFRTMVADNCSSSPIGNKVYYYDLSKFDGLYSESIGSCVKLIDTFQFRFEYVSSVEDDFWFRTNFQAPNFRIVRITLPDLNSHEDDPEAEQWRIKLLQSWKNCLDWIPQRTDGDYLASAGIAAHTVLVLKYLKDASHEVLLFDLTQNLVQESQIPVASLPHPPYGTIIGPNCNFYSSEIFYQFTSYADPSSVYRAFVDRDPFTGAISISFHEVNSTPIPRSDKYLYECEQIYVETMRNVSVPLLMFGLRDVVDQLQQEDGTPQTCPCILLVCGGFALSTTAVFSPPLQLFAKHCRGLVLVSNVQGSGIYGSAWGANGCKENKENPVTDLQSIIKYIISKGYTTPDQLALYGGTYNGTLIGAAIARFPSLFSTAVIEDGIFDLVRYSAYNPAYLDSKHLADERCKQETTWYREFGDASDSEAELRRLLALSPLHNIQSSSSITAYPAVLLMAALPPEGKTWSNSVSAIHSLKFIAQLQRMYGRLEHCKENPLLLFLTQDCNEKPSSPDTTSAAGQSASAGEDTVVERAFLGSTVEEISTAFAFIIANTRAKWVAE